MLTFVLAQPQAWPASLFVSVLGPSSYTYARSATGSLDSSSHPRAGIFRWCTDSSGARQHENSGDARLPLRSRPESYLSGLRRALWHGRSARTSLQNPATRSTILTSQLPVSRWHEQIGDPTIADGVLDRLVHNAHRIEMRGESMRKKCNPLGRSRKRRGNEVVKSLNRLCGRLLARLHLSDSNACRLGP